MKFWLDASLRRVISVCSNHFDLTYFQLIMQIGAWANFRFKCFFSVIMLGLSSNEVCMSLSLTIKKCCFFLPTRPITKILLEKIFSLTNCQLQLFS